MTHDLKFENVSARARARRTPKMGARERARAETTENGRASAPNLARASAQELRTSKPQKFDQIDKLAIFQHLVTVS